jgi:hypothetical protein
VDEHSGRPAAPGGRLTVGELAALAGVTPRAVVDPELLAVVVLVGVQLLRTDVVVRFRAVAGLLRRPTRLRRRRGG